MLHRVFRTAVACATLTAVGLTFSCGDTEQILLEVQLITPALPDPFDQVTRIRLSASGPGMSPLSNEADRTDEEVRIPPLSPGPDRVITVEGLDANGQVLSVGVSEPLQLEQEQPRSVSIFFARLDTFSMLSARLSQGRHSHTATLLADGRVVIAGGKQVGNPDDALSSVEIYDPDEESFGQAPALTRKRFNHAAVLSGNNVVLVGGEAGEEPLTSVEIYDPSTGTQKELQLKTARWDHTATLLTDGRILVVGGRDNWGQGMVSVEIIDPDKGTVTQGPPLTPGRMGHVAVLLEDGRVLVAGGGMQKEEHELNDAHIYDPDKPQEWIRVAEMPVQRSGAAGVLLPDGSVLVAGGEGEGAGEQKSENTAARYMPTGASWQKIQLAAKYKEHAAVALTGGALVAGGKETRSAERLEEGKPRSAGELQRARERFTLTTLLDGTVLAVGGRSGNNATLEAEIFIPR